MTTRMSPQHFNEVSAFRAVANAGILELDLKIALGGL